MLLDQAIIEVLRNHSSKTKMRDTKPLNVTEITNYLIQDFPDEHRAKPITPKRVRRALNNMVNSELSKDDNDRSICYTAYERNGEEYKTNYWTPRSISDVELKYLIDSVLYSKIFDTETAQDLAERIQQMSGKTLHRMTSYAAGNLFGRQRLTSNVNVLDNIQLIMDAAERDAFINFNWNVYDVIGKKIGLKKIGSYTVKPIQIILGDGRYFMLARYHNKDKIYTFSVDLMSEITINNKIQDKVKTENLERDFNRARYLLQHPYNMGGTPEHFKLRVKRDYLSRIVDMFSYEIEIIPNSITETTVDIKVRASQEGMKRLLLFHYDAVEILDPGDKFEEQLLEAVNALCGKYRLRTSSQVLGHL